MSRKKQSFKPKKARSGSKKTPPPGTRREKIRLNDSLDTIFGFHAVYEALKNADRKHHTLIATENAAIKLKESLSSLPLDAQIVSANDISEALGSDMVHQGLLLQSAPLRNYDLEDIGDDKLILLLDQITDPHNIGAIMRSACAFGARYIIMTDRHTPGDNMTTTKSASGAREYIHPVRVTNLSRAIEELKNKGFLVIGLDSEAECDLADPHTQKLTLNAQVALVMGAEGKGLRRLTREKCDILARINASGPIVSLNVSNAAALALYELSRNKEPGS